MKKEEYLQNPAQEQESNLHDSSQELKQEILRLENEVKRLEDSTREIIQSIKERIQNLKEIAWDRQSKKESAQMYKVLQQEKEWTQVKSNVGDIRVDKEFMQKEIQKHLDNPALRGMVTKQEMLSFPKVAKNVEAEYEERQQGYAWRVKADDESIINYGERDYGKGHRLLTAHSRTERGERGQPHREFNDRNFHNSVNESITQNNKDTEIIPQNKVSLENQKDESHFNNLSLEEKLEHLEIKQQEIFNLPRARDILNQQSTMNLQNQEKEFNAQTNQQSQNNFQKSNQQRRKK